MISAIIILFVFLLIIILIISGKLNRLQVALFGAVITISIINSTKCIGCGICVQQCPRNAINFNRKGPKSIFIQSPKSKEN